MKKNNISNLNIAIKESFIHGCGLGSLFVDIHSLNVFVCLANVWMHICSDENSYFVLMISKEICPGIIWIKK